MIENGLKLLLTRAWDRGLIGWLFAAFLLIIAVLSVAYYNLQKELSKCQNDRVQDQIEFSAKREADTKEKIEFYRNTLQRIQSVEKSIEK